MADGGDELVDEARDPDAEGAVDQHPYRLTRLPPLDGMEQHVQLAPSTGQRHRRRIATVLLTMDG
jgi:hypothetical protein